MRRSAIFLALVAIGGVAHAGDKPLYQPVPTWVKPVTPPPISTKPDEMPVRILLSDQQIALEPDRQTVYSEVALHIQTPQGLGAGNISVPWKPDIGDLIVHKLLIRREGKVIDVLASGQTFTVARRETNLESATLDGVLTANIQPEGLQVGDIVEFATSVTMSDPVMKGHVEAVAAAWNGAPIGRAHLRMHWPSSVPLRLRQTAALPTLKPVNANGVTSVELTLDKIEPVLFPKGSPPRYRIGRVIEATDFASWADLGALMAPLYRKASILPSEGPLRAEVDRIRALSPDPEVRAEAALALVQDRVRYVALAMGSGGMVPADAGVTWSRRYGDCKGKTVLLLAILHALGIEAQPVAVSSALGDGMDARLPMVGAFDHVLVRATIAGRSYWMDGTRKGDVSLDRLIVPAFGWGLPLIEKGAALVRMVPAPLDVPTHSVSVRIDARKGLTVPAPVKVETILRGDAAIGANAGLAGLAGEVRDRALRSYWKGQYDFIDVSSTSATFDAKAGEQKLVMEGRARMDWSSGYYEADDAHIGYKADFTRDAGPDRDAPFSVPYPYFNKTVETILLPPGFPDMKPGGKNDVDRTISGVEYRRTVRLTNGVFSFEKTERSIAPEFPAKDAAAAEATLRELADYTLHIRRPASYRPTDAEIEASMEMTPKTANAFVDRGFSLLQRERLDEAIKDFDAALILEPKNVMALADRAIARVARSQFELAEKDLDAAHAIDPRNAIVFQGRGALAQMKENPRDAIAAYTTSLQIEPDNRFTLGRRALAYQAIGDNEAALADAGAVIANDPSIGDAYLLRATVYQSMGKTEQALGEAVAVVKANPDSAHAHAVAGNIYGEMKRPADAMREFGLAVAIKPEAYIYLSRLKYRPESDRAGRLADLEAAAKLDPKSIEVQTMRADFQADSGDLAGAIMTYTAALKIEPSNSAMLHGRAVANRAIGNNEAALADASAAIASNPRYIDAYLLRANIFRSTGKTEQMLGEAVAVVKANPDNAYAHVAAGNLYGAAKRDADAMREYSRALAIKPEAYIYVNRMGYRPKSDRAGRLADLEAAAKLDPKSFAVQTARADFQADGGDLAGAIMTYTAALKTEPNDGFTLHRRALANRAIGDNEAALADASAAIVNDPSVIEPYALRANIFRSMGKMEQALVEAAAVVKANPQKAYAHVVAANVYSAAKRDADAAREYDRALAIKPEPYIYLSRLKYRPKSDRAGRLADIEAAARLNPKSIDVQKARAEYQADGGDLAGAITTYTDVLANEPEDPNLLTQRGILRVRSGDARAGEADFAAARAKATDAAEFNNMCWEKATAGVALNSALADCDAALAKSPDAAAYVDSKGLVLLRLGRIDEAIATYDRAIGQSRAIAPSLFGRAVAHARKGDKARSDADLTAALKVDPNVKEDFAGYGVEL